MSQTEKSVIPFAAIIKLNLTIPKQDLVQPTNNCRRPIRQ